MKTFIKSIIITIVTISCNTKYNYIDSGLSNGIHQCSMLEYLQKDSYNWDSIVVMIKHAGLEKIFKGEDSNYKQITFLGATNHSIRNYMLDSAYISIKDIPSETCKKIILKHIINRRYMINDIPKGSIASNSNSDKKGGINITTIGNSRLWLYTIQFPYDNIEEAGPLTLHILSIDYENNIPIACPDIQTNNGIVISLDYSYYFDTI